MHDLSCKIRRQRIVLNHTKIGLGMAALGRPEYINIRRHPDPDKSKSAYKESAFKVLDLAYEKGVRHFDTAASYGIGEQFLLEWYQIHAYKDVEFSTKWGYSYVADWEIGYGGKHEVKEHSLAKLKEQWLQSKNLLPGLSTYQIHSATFESGVLKNSPVLLELQEIKNRTGIKIGLSVSGPDQAAVLEAALLVKTGQKPLFDSFQVTYNILEQSCHSVLRDIISSGKTVMIKEALANGRIFKNERFSHYGKLYKSLEALSNKYGVGADAIALRFVIDHLKPQILLSGASNTLQLSENLKALDFQLTNEELQHLRTLSADVHYYWQERQLLEWQ